MTELLTFNEAIQKSNSCSTRHLLLGNGFSIACVPTIFTYNSLFAEADFSENPEIELAFKKLSTTDFELVISALEKSSILLPAYSEKLDELCDKMNLDADKIKELLIDTIANRHPEFPSQIEDEKYAFCRKFLSNFVFKGSKGRVYTLNYDLLLYWALMHIAENEEYELMHNDGFGRYTFVENGEVEVSNELTWQGKSTSQNIHYIHGALHLFDVGFQLEKFSWIDTGTTLIQQARKALKQNKFPLFVTEGESEKKMNKITHNAYLFNSYDSFEGVAQAGVGRPGNTCLFTYGVSFSENDRHIFNKVANGKIKKLFVGIYGDPSNTNNRQIIFMAESLKSSRRDYPLEIEYYDSQTANVWG